MRPQYKRKLVAGLASATGAAVLALATLTAGAYAAPSLENEYGYGPQSTNVPYVAWVGEHVRLVVCEPNFTEEVDNLAVKHNTTPKEILEGYQFFNVNFAVEDWSGYQFQPPTPDGEAGSEIGQYFDPGPASFFFSSEGKICVATDYKSLNPGLTRIRAVVKDDETGEVVFSHQFLVIWLTANKPVLHEAGTTASGTETFQSELSPTGEEGLSKYLGDVGPDGEATNEFLPTPFSNGSEEDKGLIQVRVTGSFPVIPGVPLSNILPESSYTLPADWAELAETLSSSQEEIEEPGSNPMLWDIHGTPGEDPWHANADEYAEFDVNTVSGKAEGECESGDTSSGLSSTDNCNGGEAVFGEFSREFKYLTYGPWATVGPYDPQAGEETLLSDGRLNADDAPMPAMRIDVSIAANTPGGLNGVGHISGANKAVVYSHDFNGDDSAHNLYNPYYAEFIPATERDVPQASGITGPSPGGDFPGFLNTHDGYPYEFWESVHSGNDRTSHSTECLRREYNSEDSSFYETPSGPRTETFYTDERGEAYVEYSPGDEFYLENLPKFLGKPGEKEGELGSVIKNNNGGCDLKFTKGAVIGTSEISATAVYPYEPVDYRGQTSEPLTKVVKSDYEKEWFEFSKGPGANEGSVKIIVAKAQDIDGRPITDEEVCFKAPNGGLVSHFGPNEIDDENNVLGFGAGWVVVGPSTVTHVGGPNEICELTNDNGLAAIEVTNSVLPEVDLNVEYMEEHVIRDHTVIFGTGVGAPSGSGKIPPTGNTPVTTTPVVTPAGSTPTGTGTGSGGGSSSGSTTTTVTTTGTTLVTPLVIKSTPKPLTNAQKLAKALKACKKDKSKKKRVACETSAKHAYSAKKSSKK